MIATMYISNSLDKKSSEMILLLEDTTCMCLFNESIKYIISNNFDKLYFKESNKIIHKIIGTNFFNEKYKCIFSSKRFFSKAEILSIIKQEAKNWLTPAWFNGGC